MVEILNKERERGVRSLERVTISVPEAARRLGIGRNQGYEAAARGEIPTIRLGKRLLVPVAAFEAMLAVKSKQEIVATELVRRLQAEGGA